MFKYVEEHEDIDSGVKALMGIANNAISEHMLRVIVKIIFNNARLSYATEELGLLRREK